ADRQLDGTEYALVSGRFFREELAASLPGDVRPIILLQGTVRAGDRRVGRVTVIGVDDRFGLGDLTPKDSAATVSDSLARALSLAEGKQIDVSVQKASAIPRSSALAKRGAASATKTFPLTVAHVLSAGHPAGEFTLSPGPATVLNLIVPLRTLEKEIDQPGRVNTLLSGPQPLQPLQETLERQLTLNDWDLKVHVPPTRHAYVSIESRRLILEPAAVDASRMAAEELGYHAAPTFVYLANGIAANGAEIPYSVVAGIDPNEPSPLNPVGQPFADDKIVLVDWKESPLKVKPGDAVTLTYFQPEVEGRVEEAKHTFRLKVL